MSRIFFDELGIKQPSFHLGISGLGHSRMTAKMLEEIAECIGKIQPDAVMVYGDCNTTLAGGLAAKQQKTRLIHVEAGLRSNNKNMPEELNRIIVDRISDVLFCPSQTAVSNLEKEGFQQLGCDYILSGDVMEDAALRFSDLAEKKSTLFKIYPEFAKGEYILCTIHRAENIYHPDKLKNICQAIENISRERQVIIPVHPATSKQLQTYQLAPTAFLIPPVGYLDMISLVKNAGMVITDSGGLQKEAFFFYKYCITIREETEWVELVTGGYNKLAGADPDRIMQAYKDLENRDFVKHDQYFGGGHAAKSIAKHLSQYS